MNIPQPGDYINIHTHGSDPEEGVFSLENLMIHENSKPLDKKDIAYSCGIHPWYITETNYRDLLESLAGIAGDPGIVAIGECGFDKLRGPSPGIQRLVFEEQVKMAMELSKPVIIHCVRSWDELLASHKRMNPSVPWMVHGFRRKTGLAEQLISRNMYISFWFDFVLRPESAHLIKNLPEKRIFLETDGADIDIRDIYRKVSVDLEMSVEELRDLILNNYRRLFNLGNIG